MENYYSVAGDKVCTIYKHCFLCTEAKFLSAPVPLQLFEYSITLLQIQNDLIDKHNLDSGLKCIFNAKDYFSKFSAIYCLTNKRAITVAIDFINQIR
jgi:hypothetical protein